MKEVDAAPQRILDPVPARVACHDLSSGLVAVVGQEERGRVASQAGDCNLSQFPLVGGDVNDLLKIPDVLISAFWSIDHGTAPCGIRLVGKTANDSAPPSPDGD